MNTLVARIRAALQKFFFWHESGKRSSEFTPEPAHDHALVLEITKPASVPHWRQLRYIGRVLNTKERRLLAITVTVFVLALGGVAWAVGRSHLIAVPAKGGRVVEAIIGSPKYPNPLYDATNDPDRDLVALIYSGLFRRVDGSNVVPDLAERYEWSKDGKTLTLTLRTDARFHDGVPVTADDVIFTLNATKDPAWRSPLAGSLHSMTFDHGQDPNTVVVTLTQPDVGVLDTLTLGILPAHIWQDISPGSAPLADANVRPIGAGPFQIRSFRRDSRGAILAYTLDRNDRYHGIKPLLAQLELRFFADRAQAEDALRNGQVDALAFVPGQGVQAFTKHERLTSTTLELPQETIAFFNVNDPLLKDAKIRQALSLALDRTDIVDAQAGIASPVSGPYPFGSYINATSSPEERLDTARALLQSAGWAKPDNGDVRVKAPPKKVVAKPATTTVNGKKTTPAPEPVATSTSAVVLSNASSTFLTLTITVPNVPDLLAVADVLQRRWSLLGAKVEVLVDEPEALARNATTQRDAQILVWNVLLGPAQDLYPVWWSAEATGHGLNLSNLTDRNVDDAIEDVRAATSTSGLQHARDVLSTTILSRWPAVFLTRPGYGYIFNKRVHGVNPRLQLGRPSDRFNDAPNWYVNTGWRWK